MDAVTAILFVIGLVLLLVGAEVLVRGASSLATGLGVSPLVVGLTVVAFGTSAPELAVSAKAAWSGNAGFAVGNVVGSNIFNVLFILGLSAIVVPLFVQKQLVRLDVPIMVLVSLVVVVMAQDGRLSRLESVLLLAGLAGYTVLLLRLSRRQSPADIRAGEQEAKPADLRALPVNLVLIAGGLGMLVVGSRWLVSGATDVAEAIGVSDIVISLTIVAAGTSLPEIATSVLASLKGERDIAVGNAVGSCIMNLLLVLGVAGIVSGAGLPIPESVQSFDLLVMLAVAIACLPIFFTGRIIARWEGMIFLAYYVAYTLYLILDATDHDALSSYETAMIYFVVPLTVLTLAVVLLRSLRSELHSSRQAV